MFLHQNPAGGRDAPVKAGGDKIHSGVERDYDRHVVSVKSEWCRPPLPRSALKGPVLVPPSTGLSHVHRPARPYQSQPVID